MVTIELPRDVSFVSVALQRMGGRGSFSRICGGVRELFPKWADDCGSTDNFTRAVRQTIEDYCQDSPTWSPSRPACFERVGADEYRLVPPERRVGERLAAPRIPPPNYGSSPTVA